MSDQRVSTRIGGQSTLKFTFSYRGAERGGAAGINDEAGVDPMAQIHASPTWRV
jgi:hypothetical protein